MAQHNGAPCCFMRMLRDIFFVYALCVLACTQLLRADEFSGTLLLAQNEDLSPEHYAHVGQAVNYTLTATNTGTSALHNLNIVTSLSLSNFECSPATPAALEPQEVMTCFGQYIISEEDFRAGSLQNIAYATSDEASAESTGQMIYAALGHLSLLVKVVNNNKGQATDDMWQVSASGKSSLEGWGFVEEDVIVGEYTLKRESGPSGYVLKSLYCKDEAGVELPLVENNVVSIEEGANIVCEFTYDDKVPKAKPASVNTSEPPSYNYIPSIRTDIPPLVDSPTTAGVGTGIVVDPGCSCSANPPANSSGSFAIIGISLLAFAVQRRSRRRH